MLKNNIKFERRSKQFDMTQKEVAEAVGLSVISIYKIENGQGCTVETALKLAKLFKCNVEDLFQIDEGE